MSNVKVMEAAIVGSGSYSQSWRAIPTHRYGGPAHVSTNPEWQHTSGSIIVRKAFGKFTVN